MTQKIPREVIIIILDYVPITMNFLQLALVSTEWAELCYDEARWKLRVQKDFSNLSFNFKNDNYRRLYFQLLACHLTEPQASLNLRMYLAGNANVGKTCLKVRYTNNMFIEDYNPTISENFKRIVVINKLNHIIEVNELPYIDYQIMVESDMRCSDCLIVCFDITNRKSFQEANKWYDMWYNIKKEKAPVVLCGLKGDLFTEREVTIQEALHLAFLYSTLYFEVSAKTGENMEQLFTFSIIKSFKYHEMSLQRLNTIIKKKKKYINVLQRLLMKKIIL
jgi:small GTP-binding protein